MPIFARMNRTRTVTLLLLTVIAQAVSGQRQLVVADVETLVPVVGADVVGRGMAMTTDSLGRFTLNDSCMTLVFSHVNYESRMVNIDEVRDTVFLYSKFLNLREVVVLGQGKRDNRIEELQSRLRLDKTEAQLLASNPANGGSLCALLKYIVPKKWLRNRKAERKKRLKQMLDEY